MANLDRSFDIVGKISDRDPENIQRALKSLTGVNHIKVDPQQNKIIVGYTPGMITVQTIKETIEDQGLDVSDMGDD